MTMLVRLPVMLAQQVNAVVISIGCTHDGVNVKFEWYLVCQEQAGMVVEFDKNHGTLNPIVKRILGSVTTDPAEVRVVQVLFELLQFCLARSVG